jgi:hypothetical protein
MRYQQIYDASQFSAVDPGGEYITEIFFRADGGVLNAGALVTNIQINLSTTPQSVTNLSPSFAHNVGSDDTVVFGPQSLFVEGSCCPGSSPQGFGVRIALRKPFFYNPAIGNLLLDVRNFTGAAASLQSSNRLDAATETSSASNVADSVDAGSGVVVISGLVTMFVMSPIPIRTPSLVVVPNDLRYIEGDYSSIYPFFIEQGGLSSMRYQQLYAASQFAAAGPDGGYITSLYFRANGGSGAADFITNIQINLSTTSRSVSSLSPAFANNVGADDTVIFGPAALMTSGGGLASPNDFDVKIPVNTPFYYSPSAGNLLIDIRNFTGGLVPYQSIKALDATAKNSLSFVYGNPVEAGTGMGFIGGLVTEFVIAPPPALWIQEGTNSVLIAWPTQPTVFVLQRTSSLKPANWQTITNGVTGNSTFQTLTLPRDSLGTQQFFRLVWESGPPGVN